MDIPNDTIANLEATIDLGADFVHSAGHVTAKNSRPLLDEDAHLGHVPVEGVDGDGSILDDDLVGTDQGHGG